MLSILAVVCLFVANIHAQVEKCRLDEEYREIYQELHQRVNRGLVWYEGMEKHAKEEALAPGSKTGDRSPYVKVDGELTFSKDDGRDLTAKVQEVLRKKFIRGLSKKVRGLSSNTPYACNGVYNTEGAEDKLTVVCLYNKGSSS